MKKGIIFDLDGTLWDSLSQVVPAWNIALKRNGAEPITMADMGSYMGKTLEEIAAAKFPELELEEGLAILKQCCNEEQQYLRENGGVLYPELERTLETLKKEYGLYIVSNCHTEYLDSFFIAHGLKYLFEDSETHGGTGLSKAENIRLIIERNGLNKYAYVGDTIMDKQAADKADVPFIYAAYGFGNVEDAEYSIDKISDLPDLLRRDDL